MRKVREQRVLHGLVAHVALYPALRGARARGSDSNRGGWREYLLAPVAHELLEGASQFVHVTFCRALFAPLSSRGGAVRVGMSCISVRVGVRMGVILGADVLYTRTNT